jgi:hypothetical protein
MPRHPAPAVPHRTRTQVELEDAADESIGRLTVVNQILLRRINGETAPGGWDLGTATDIIDMVIGVLRAARGGER